MTYWSLLGTTFGICLFYLDLVVGLARDLTCDLSDYYLSVVRDVDEPHF